MNRSHPHARSARRATELAVAVPQVIAHRVARMAAAGPWPGARDRREFHTMGAEKLSAFGESWSAMWIQAVRAQQALLLSLWQWWLPRPGGLSLMGAPRRWTGLQRWQHDVARVFEHGLAPVHRRAVANAKRLGSTRRAGTLR